MTDIATVHVPLAGFFKLEAVRPDGSRRVLADWFPNLILEAGLDRMGANSDYLNACQVGTNNTAPVTTDTGLAAYLAGSNTIQSTTLFAAGSAPYYGAKTRVYRFAAGVATGNLSEVGVGWATSGSALFSRALILDGASMPTTITVLGDEVLDVTYQLRQYAPTVDVTGTVVDGADSYDFTLRAARVTDASGSGGWASGVGAASGQATSSVPFLRVYTGAIGAVTAEPAGTSASISTGTNLGYSSTSYQRDFTLQLGLDQGNLTGGIRSAKVPTTRGEFQCEFDPPIPKDETKTLTLSFRITWARR